MNAYTHIQGGQCDCPPCRQMRAFNGYGQTENNTPPYHCKICGGLFVPPNSIVNTYERICKCTPAERQQLTEADVRRIIREEIAKISVQNLPTEEVSD